jgi:hypothetical protein
MKKHAVISLAMIAIFLSLPFIVNAATFVNNTTSFGGKVLLTQLPLVTCSGSGTGPIVLISNLASVATAAYSTTPKTGQTAIQHVGGVAKGIYGAIPYYTTSGTSGNSGSFTSSKPKAGDWILGRADTIPEFTTCKIQIATYKIPFPVKDTSNYKTSGNSSGLSL